MYFNFSKCSVSSDQEVVSASNLIFRANYIKHSQFRHSAYTKFAAETSRGKNETSEFPTAKLDSQLL